MAGVVIVGSSNTDMVLNVPEIPEPGQTLSGSCFTVTGGGKGANQAVAVAKALSGRAQTCFVACVGDDDLGQSAIKGFEEVGIDTKYVSVEKEVASGVALIFVADSGENCIGINPGANAKLDVKHILEARDAIAGADILLAQLECPIKTNQKAFELAKESGTKTILNPAPAYELPEEIFEMLDYFTPNQTETEMYTGVFPDSIESAKKAGEILLGKGVKNAIITMGSKGSFYIGEEGEEFVQARKVKAIDTVAAGDTFNGAFAAGISVGMSVIESLEFASTAAAIAVTRKGAQESAPTLSEILAFES